jgi:hypothetical protein
MAQSQTRPAHGLDKVDPVWTRIRQEAEEIARREPELASFLYENILHRSSLESAVAHRVSQRLDHADVSSDLIRQAFSEAFEDTPSIGEAFRADIGATLDRDPATTRWIELRYFPLSRRYQLRETGIDDVRSFATPGYLIAALGSLRINLPAAFADLPASTPLQLSARIDPAALPGALRLPALFEPAWRLSARDFAWTIAAR